MKLLLLNQGGLWCFLRPFWKENSFQNIEKFIVIIINLFWSNFIFIYFFILIVSVVLQLQYDEIKCV